jgi:hypothetical protein
VLLLWRPASSGPYGQKVLPPLFSQRQGPLGWTGFMNAEHINPLRHFNSGTLPRVQPGGPCHRGSGLSVAWLEAVPPSTGGKGCVQGDRCPMINNHAFFAPAALGRHSLGTA